MHTEINLSIRYYYVDCTLYTEDIRNLQLLITVEQCIIGKM